MLVNLLFRVREFIKAFASDRGLLSKGSEVDSGVTFQRVCINKSFYDYDYVV